MPLVALLFLWRRRVALYDHAIFVSYSIASVSLPVVTLEIAGTVGVAGGRSR